MFIVNLSTVVDKQYYQRDKKMYQPVCISDENGYRKEKCDIFISNINQNEYRAIP